MGGWFRGPLGYFPTFFVQFLVCFQISPTIVRQKTVHNFVTLSWEIRTNDIESRFHFYGLVITISGWILTASCPLGGVDIPSQDVFAASRDVRELFERLNCEPFTPYRSLGRYSLHALLCFRKTGCKRSYLNCYAIIGTLRLQDWHC